MRLVKRVFVGLLCTSFLLNCTIPVKADGAFLFNTSIFCDTSNEGCNADELKTASFICVNKLSEDGLQKVLTNPNLEQIQIADITNLPLEDVAKLYPLLCKDNIEYSAILLAYENLKDSVGNDGTPVYMSAVDEYAPDSAAYYRSCATTVSVILNAAGYLKDYSSAGCSGLVSYFETHPDEWSNMGKLAPSQMQVGDVIFIDRQSHKADYIKGILSDADLDLTPLINTLTTLGGEQANEVTKPKGKVTEVFNPDRNGDGIIDSIEAQKWCDYWIGKTGEVPPFEYYETWKKEAEEYTTRATEVLHSLDENTLKALVGQSLVIHNHIILWLGNDVIRKYYPESEGNIISGSYSDSYDSARSAAVSYFNFTGDYRIYRHKR